MKMRSWPDRPLAELPVRWAPVSAHNGRLVWGDDHVEEFLDHRLDHELALRELRLLDTADSDAVLAFMNTHGAIDQTYPRSLPMKTPQRPPTSAHRPDVADAAAYLLTVQCLVDHWIAHTESQPVAPHWQAAGFDVAYDGVAIELKAWELFAENLALGLQAYAPRVEFELDAAPELTFGAATPDLFGGLCLQLFNVIAGNIPPRRCGARNCPNYFVRQGEAEAEQHRTRGVLYCSTTCQNAERQRRFRERARAERARETGR
jgi:hypothetical protein